MTEPNRQDHDRERTGTAIGIVIVVIGVWLLTRELGLIPPIVLESLRLIRSASWLLALIIAGVAIILFASRSRESGSPHLPSRGTRVYRSRTDKMIAGVFGGLGRYFSVDPTVLRLGFVAVGFLFDWGPAIVAYIVAAIVMPAEFEA